ncbi:hypothetical protein IWQ62_002715 [Dispira parvispora]|uniref:histone acetyltransferase n=1 Tax=Dispira parvispora TaxID=1520584 RepID=A0A9W8AV75_9FUNG|nr:hypothetical protein IWQ62_002715 [Dispira parvispora]
MKRVKPTVADSHSTSTPSDNPKRVRRSSPPRSSPSHKCNGHDPALLRSDPSTNGTSTTRQVKSNHTEDTTGTSGLHTISATHDDTDKPPPALQVVWGPYRLTTWYEHRYPATADPYYVCEWCFKYMRQPETLVSHQPKCTYREPPGAVIYKEGHRLRAYTVDGKQHKLYCQNLCLFGKLFLDNKTVCFDIERFDFYVLTTSTTSTSPRQTVGYFSKEKHSPENYNLACIVVFPPFQGQGYGRLLVELSYQLSVRLGQVGTPERPLSQQATLAYSRHWQRAVLSALAELNQEYIPLSDVAERTGMVYPDILTALYQLGLMRHWHGKLIVCIPKEDLRTRLKQWSTSLNPRIREEALVPLPM